MLPDLPKAKYKVWVRGYGLVNSPKVDSEPGKQLNLTAVIAPNDKAAARILSGHLLVFDDPVPGADQFPGTGPAATASSRRMRSQGEYARHPQDQRLRHLPPAWQQGDPHDPGALGKFANGYEAWTRRIQSGQASTQMVNNIGRMGAQAALKMLGDWTDRIAAGELPATKPHRPQGVERNAVVTV